MTTETFSEALRALLPEPGADEADHLPAFRRVADLVLNRATWHIGGRPHRLVEIELYFTGPGHEDPFTHGDPIQRTFGVWYFHRQGTTYKGGTYKGLDIAFGRPDAAAGILLRAVEPLDGAGALVEGPSSLVDHVLRLTGRGSVAELAGAFDRSVDAGEEGGSPLYLTLDDAHPAATVYESARVGLSLKKGADLDRRRFLPRPYRFLTEPARIKKGRPYLVVALHEQGHDVRQIAELTGAQRGQVERYLAGYASGRGRDPESYRRDLTPEELCEMLGALA